MTAIKKVVEKWHRRVMGRSRGDRGVFSSVAVYFGAYSSCKKYFTSIMPDNTYLLAVAISASIGNTFASILRVPYEVIKQRMQMASTLARWKQFAAPYKRGRHGDLCRRQAISQIHGTCRMPS